MLLAFSSELSNLGFSKSLCHYPGKFTRDHIILAELTDGIFYQTLEFFVGLCVQCVHDVVVYVGIVSGGDWVVKPSPHDTEQEQKDKNEKRTQ